MLHRKRSFSKLISRFFTVFQTSSAAHPSLPPAPTGQPAQTDLASVVPGTEGSATQAPGPVMEVAVAMVSSDLGSSPKQPSRAKVLVCYRYVAACTVEPSQAGRSLPEDIRLSTGLCQ